MSEQVTTDDDYLAQLRATMADPAEAPWFECPYCPHRFAVRAWPGERDDRPVIAAMLDGLAELKATTGRPVFGIYMFDVDGELPSVRDMRAIGQLWRPGDTAPLVEGPQGAMLKFTTEHPCPGRAEMN